jgi:hypothetical protein
MTAAREATRGRNGPDRKADRPRGAGAVARAHPPSNKRGAHEGDRASRESCRDAAPRAVAVGPRAHARASEPSTPSLEASPLLVRVQYEGNGPGGVYRFVPAVARARGMMTRLFPYAVWHRGAMHVEHRYAADAARALLDRGVRLERLADGAPLAIVNGGFAVPASAPSPEDAPTAPPTRPRERP